MSIMYFDNNNNESLQFELDKLCCSKYRSLYFMSDKRGNVIVLFLSSLGNYKIDVTS